MWIFGKASKKEIKELKKYGYEVTEVDLKHFDLCLDSKASKQEQIPDKNKMIAVWVDNDMVEQLTRWHNEEKAGEEVKRITELQDLRKVIANKIWDETSFGDDIRVIDFDEWETDGDIYIRKFFYADNEEPKSGQGGCKWATFIVTFKPNSDMAINEGSITW